MELRHLRYFIAVAEELHFGRAAERLGIAQPPLSQQIRRLEEDLGVQLLIRTKRRVELSDAGRVLLAEGRLVLAQAEQAARAAKRASRGETGQLAVGFVGSATYHILPLILSAFRERFPEVQLKLCELFPTEQVQALQEGRIQVGFFRSHKTEDSLKYEPVLQEPLVVALPEGHPLTKRSRVPVRALAREPFVIFPRHIGPSFYDFIVSLCHKSGFSPQIAQEASEIQTIVSLVAGGTGVALVPASCRNFRRIGVIYKPMPEPSPRVQMIVACRRDDQSPVLHQFLRVAREVAHKAGGVR